jgi:hypothetical protein
LFLKLELQFLHKSKNPPNTGENRSMIIHNPQNSGQFHFHHWTKSISTARLQTPFFIKSCSRIAEILLHSCIDGDFAVVILTVSKSFFYYGIGE